MWFAIVITETAGRHFESLDAHSKAMVKQGIETHLRHEPWKVSKSRIKRLRDMEQPEYRLRIADYRVFYDIVEAEVIVLAILPKNKTQEWLDEFGVEEL